MQQKMRLLLSNTWQIMHFLVSELAMNYEISPFIQTNTALTFSFSLLDFSALLPYCKTGAIQALLDNWFGPNQAVLNKDDIVSFRKSFPCGL